MASRPKATIQFPRPEGASADGLVRVGGELTSGNLVEAYAHGIFPWPQEGLPMLWFSPDPRGVLVFEEIHISKSLRKQMAREEFQFSFNQAFEQVIEYCSIQKRKGQDGTWILPDMKQAYLDLHRLGYAQSVEAWQEGRLVGGLYGVFVEGVFSGESMFHLQTGASKLSLLYLVEHLQSLGLQWMDTQMVTPVLEGLGAREIPRSTYLKWLKKSQESLSDCRFS